MDFDTELIKGNVQTIILAVLESGSLHGYGLAKEIELRSEETLAFGEGTIYPALRALERQELILGEWVAGASGPAKKIYSITERGRRELCRRKDTWKRFVASVNLIVEGEPHARTA